MTPAFSYTMCGIHYMGYEDEKGTHFVEVYPTFADVVSRLNMVTYQMMKEYHFYPVAINVGGKDIFGWEGVFKWVGGDTVFLAHLMVAQSRSDMEKDPHPLRVALFEKIKSLGDAREHEATEEFGRQFRGEVIQYMAGMPDWAVAF